MGNFSALVPPPPPNTWKMYYFVYYYNILLYFFLSFSVLAVLISFERPVYNFVEGDGSVYITVVKDGDSDQAITVRVAGGKTAAS